MRGQGRALNFEYVKVARKKNSLILTLIMRLLRDRKLLWSTLYYLSLSLILTLVLDLAVASAESISFSGLIIDRPKIRVVSYRVQATNPNLIREDLSCPSRTNCDELVTGVENGSNLGQDGDESKEWSVPPNVTQLTLQCSSKSGPVEWDYQGKGKFTDIEIQSRRIAGDFWVPTSYVHNSELTFNSVNDQLTGTFICRSVEKPSVSNSFYMFVPQEKRPILNPKEKFVVAPFPSRNSVIIPCRVEDRESSIHLYKKMDDGSLKRMNMDASVSLKFNPYLGFELDLSPEVYGDYVCKIDKKSKKPLANDDVDEEDDDKTEARKLGRKKRQKRFVERIQTSTSPGFSAFPTSEEIASGSVIVPEFVQAMANGMGMTVNPEEVSITNPESEADVDVEVPSLHRDLDRPMLRRRWGILGKRPLFVRRKVSQGGSQFSRRGGPHHYPGQGQRPRLRPRPLLGPFRRRPPPPHYAPHFHPYHDGRPPMIAVPGSMSMLPTLVPESGSQSEVNPNQTKNGTISSSSTEQVSSSPSTPIPSKDYFWPPLRPVQHVIHEEHEIREYEGIPQYPPSPQMSMSSPSSRFPGLPSILESINKLSMNSRPRPTIRPFAPTSSEEALTSSSGTSSSELSLKQKEKDSSSSIEDSSVSPTKNRKKPPRRGAAGAILSPNLLPQTMNIMNSMSCVLKKVMLGPEAPCNSSFFDAASIAQAASAFSRNPALNLNSKRRPQTQPISGGGGSGGGGLLGGKPEDQITLLEVTVAPLPANKFFPPEPTLYTTVPFYVKWQTESTDYSNWAEVNHTLTPGTFKLHKAGTLSDHGIHSFEVFNLRDGETGKISVPFVIGTGSRSKKKIGSHTWEFVVINSTTASEKGLTQRGEGSKNIFVCKSATSNKPRITLTKLGDDGCPIDHEGGSGNGHRSEKKRKVSKKKSFVEEDCGEGCISIRTDIEAGVVHCFGDGVDQSLRYPVDLHCTGRPFFVERGKTKNLTLSQNKKKLIFPCVINNPNADVYLFHQNPNGTISDVTDFTSYDLKIGFSLNLEEISEPLGTYACTSSVNVEDDSDMVTYHVNPAPSYVFNPPQSLVYGAPPFRFVWESVEELEVENKSAGNFYSGVFAKPEGNRAYVGTFEIASLDRGGSGVVNILRSRDKEVVHSWKYAYQGKYGLWVDRKLNIFKCASSTSSKAPSLFAVECSNPNVCKLKKRFIQDDDDEEKDRHRDHSLVNVPVECGQGCRELKVWREKVPQGFVKCVDQHDDDQGQGQSASGGSEIGMEESLTYFLSRNSTILTENDDLKPFQALEISSAVRQLRVGDGITFTCTGNKYFYSKGFQWAIEMRNGSKRFLDPSVSEEKEVGSGSDSSPAGSELRAQVHLKVGDKDWRAVWCYAPSISSNSWGNASQLVYIH